MDNVDNNQQNIVFSNIYIKILIMELKKYDAIRKEIKKMDFEGKFKRLSDWLYLFSFVGNVGSIFFAYFLIYPIFNNAISHYIQTESTNIIISSIFTILILFMSELIKRIVLKNFSFDFVKDKFKIKEFSIISWLIISLGLISLSFYFSINGAMKFADNTIVVEKQLDKELVVKQDSVKSVYQEQKSIYELEISKLRSDNDEQRNRSHNLPQNFSTERQKIDERIDKNNEQINGYQNFIKDLDEELESKINEFKIEKDNNLNKTTNDNKVSVLVFILISSLIELLIIGGIYFKSYYDLTVFRKNEPHLENFLKKRDQYLVLLSYIYKKGKLTTGDVIIGVNRLKETLKDNNIQNVNKMVTSFYSDLEYNNIIKTEGKRKYFVVDYEKANEIITKLDDTVDILNKLK